MSAEPAGPGGPGPGAAFRRAQWRVLLAASFCYLFYYTGRQGLGWAIRGIQDDLRLTSTQIGWINGTALLCYGGGQVVAGWLGDRFGGRRMVAAGAVLSCALNWVTSLGAGFWSLWLPWGLNGLAQSMGFAPGSRVIVNWWGREGRGLAFGVFTFAAGFSSVLTYAGAIWVLERLSWPWVFRLPVLLLPLGALVFYRVARDRPEELGFPAPDGPGAREGPASGAAAAARPGSLGASARAVLASRPFLLASLGFGFNNWGRLGLLVWVPPHFLGPDWRTRPGAAWITVALPLGMACGALAVGWLGDRLFRADHLRVAAPCLGLAALTAAALAAVPVGAALPGLAGLFLAGFLVFGPVAAFTALGADVLDRRLVGTGLGVMNALGYAVAAAGDLVIGAAIDVTGWSGAVFPVTAVALAGGALCARAARR